MYWYTVCVNFARTAFTVKKAHSSKKCIIIVVHIITCAKITGDKVLYFFNTETQALLYNVRNHSDCATTVLQFIKDLSLALYYQVYKYTFPGTC